ncbi:hypothetical protein LNO78_24500 [Klebsiella pneumoniae subsp. pneumoniae]|nr:hypothetical protein [Klebsiella pneumoniae subsp. pneumoniae]
MKGKALLAGCIALVMSSAALAEDIKIAVVGAMSGPVAQYGDQGVYRRRAGGSGYQC